MTMGTNVWQFWQLPSTTSRPAPGGKIASRSTLLGAAAAPLVSAGVARSMDAGPPHPITTAREAAAPVTASHTSVDKHVLRDPRRSTEPRLQRDHRDGRDAIG